MDYSNSQYISDSYENTQEIAYEFGKTLTGGEVIAFRGPMGAGKTAFISGLAKAFGAEEMVSSPTFAIMNVYPGSVELHHYDMYRIEDWENLYSTGFFDDLDTENRIILIEWSENIAEFLPEEYITIAMSYGENENQRIISFKK